MGLVGVSFIHGRRFNPHYDQADFEVKTDHLICPMLLGECEDEFNIKTGVFQIQNAIKHAAQLQLLS